MRVGVVDYGMGNLASVAKAVEKVGADSFVSGDPAELGRADLVVLPGVGHFKAGMESLQRLGLTGFLKDWAAAGRPLVGICLGMQLLFTHSEEGDVAGLGIVPGDVVLLEPGVKCPQIGWNAVSAEGASSDVLAPFEGRYFYFNHSYVCRPDGDVAAGRTDYGGEFVSSVHAGNVIGFQFHPEKSSRDGLALLERALAALAAARPGPSGPAPR
ncbi:MAG: imidazole glycerol phosphate synthase subunit HisH [Actinomycetota bacterium]